MAPALWIMSTTSRRRISIGAAVAAAAALVSIAPIGAVHPAHAAVVNANASVFLGELRVTSADDVNKKK